MRKISWVIFGFLVILLATLAWLQTPIMHRVRGAAWNSWTATIGKLLSVGPLTVDHNVNQQLGQLRAENVRLQAELHDYQRLRQQLGTPSFESFRVIPVAVVGRPLDVFRTHYTINHGAADGIISHAPILTNGSVLIGFVSDLYEHSAIVALLPNPSTAIAVEILDQDSHQSVGRGLLQGQHFTSLRLVTVPRDVHLAPGQVVVTLAKESSLPPGLTIGIIGKVVADKNEAFQEANISLPYDPDSLDAASVIVPP